VAFIFVFFTLNPYFYTQVKWQQSKEADHPLLRNKIGYSQCDQKTCAYNNDCPYILSNPNMFYLITLFDLRKQKNQYNEVVDSCRYINGSSCKCRYNHSSNSNFSASVLLFIWEEPKLNSSSFTRISLKPFMATTKVAPMSERIAIHSVSHPGMTNNRAISLIPIAKAIFALMMFNVLR